MNKNCTICLEDKNEFWKCSLCRNDHCNDCHEEIARRRPKCPYCRTNFREECLDLVTYSIPIDNNNELRFIYRFPFARFMDHLQLVRNLTEILMIEDNDNDDDW